MRGRYIMEPEDRKEIVRLYKSGESQTEIARHTGFSRTAVKLTIRDEIGQYTEKDPSFIQKEEIEPKFMAKRKSYKELEQEVLKLFDEGKLAEDIVKSVKALTISEIKEILAAHKRLSANCLEKRPATVNEIRKFAASVKPGDKYNIKVNIYDSFHGERIKFLPVVIQKTYPNIVITDKGTYTYVDLYLGIKE